MKRVVSKSEKETMRIAAAFVRSLRGGEVILLDGELGAGKTTFVRGMARAFGIKEPIRSPTFTLMHIHKIKKKLPTTNYQLQTFVHVDAYRLRGRAELRELGIEEYAGRRDTVVVVEWGNRVRNLFRDYPVIKIVFYHGRQKEERRLSIYGSSPEIVSRRRTEAWRSARR